VTTIARSTDHHQVDPVILDEEQLGLRDARRDAQPLDQVDIAGEAVRAGALGLDDPKESGDRRRPHDAEVDRADRGTHDQSGNDPDDHVAHQPHDDGEDHRDGHRRHERGGDGDTRRGPPVRCGVVDLARDGRCRHDSKFTCTF
jgi:hypothetical protein